MVTFRNNNNRRNLLIKIKISIKNNFIAFFNSRNIGRKHPSDLIQAFQMFLEEIGPEFCWHPNVTPLKR